MEYLNDIFFNEASIYLDTIVIVLCVLSLLAIIEQWILFNKLGEKGWKSIIPIYNGWVYLKLGELPGWLILLPVANIIGMIVASFNIPKKLNKSSALGLLYIFIPNIYYLVLILSKNNQKNKKINEVVASNIEQASAPTENKVEERIPEFVEAPPLNTEETKIPDVTKLNNAYINITPETSTVSKEPKYDEDITSAFEMPIPEPNAKTNQTEELVDTLTKLKQSDLNLDINNEPTLELEPLETNKVPTVDNDILEETVELPKMVNEEVNSGIKVTKHCNNCGFENEYSLKNCIMCGEPLE
mgnify:FL=1